jgi:Tfp pilus assembly protein FimT
MSETGDRPTALDAQAGTTLIEALVVVSILTIISLIGFPRLSGQLASLSRRQTAAVVEARLREARAEALRNGTTVRFFVAPDGRGFGAGRGAYTAAPAGVVLSSASPSGVAGAGILFFGDGSSSGGSVWVAAAGRTIPVTVAPATGAIALGGA